MTVVSVGVTWSAGILQRQGFGTGPPLRTVYETATWPLTEPG